MAESPGLDQGAKSGASSLQANLRKTLNAGGAQGRDGMNHYATINGDTAGKLN